MIEMNLLLSTWMSCETDIGHLLNYTQKGDWSHYVCRTISSLLRT
jgi:hypothetical protein